MRLSLVSQALLGYMTVSHGLEGWPVATSTRAAACIAAGPTRKRAAVCSQRESMLLFAACAKTPRYLGFIVQQEGGVGFRVICAPPNRIFIYSW
jgi:hypothetical protein